MTDSIISTQPTLAFAKRLRDAARLEYPWQHLSPQDTAAVMLMSLPLARGGSASHYLAAGDIHFANSIELLLAAKVIQEEATASLPRIEKFVAQTLKSFMRNTFPEMVRDSVFYAKSQGVKFWGIRTQGKTAKDLCKLVQTALDNEPYGRNFTVYIGISPGGRTTVLFIMDKNAKAPHVEPFYNDPFAKKQRAAARRKAKRERDSWGEGTPDSGNVQVPLKVLRAWKETLDNFHTDNGSVRRVTAEMRKYI